MPPEKLEGLKQLIKKVALRKLKEMEEKIWLREPVVVRTTGPIISIPYNPKLYKKKTQN